MHSIVFLIFFAAQSGPDTEIRAVIAAYAGARQQQDPKAVEALFTGDADQLVSSGEWRRGRAQLVDGTMASSRRNEGTRTLAVESIRLLSADVALADARYEIASAAQTRKMWSTFILRRTPSGWRIAAIRNMLPAN